LLKWPKIGGAAGFGHAVLDSDNQVEEWGDCRVDEVPGQQHLLHMSMLLAYVYPNFVVWFDLNLRLHSHRVSQCFPILFQVWWLFEVYISY